MKNVNDKVGFVLKIDERATEGKAEKRLWEKSWVKKYKLRSGKGGMITQIPRVIWLNKGEISYFHYG